MNKTCLSLCPLFIIFFKILQNKAQCRSDYNVYSTFQSHEPEFDYLKSLEIEEKINKIRWLPQKNAAQFLLSTNGECIGGRAGKVHKTKGPELTFSVSWT